MRDRKKLNIVKMVELALLTAIVLVLQLLGIGIKLPFLATPVSLVLIPITLGAMLLGPMAGAWLGLVFGLEVYIVCGVMGTDPFFTAILFAEHPVLTLLTCVIKSTVAGFVAGVIYRLFQKKNTLGATFAAAALTPILNTGIFMLGCLAMFDSISHMATGAGQSFLYFVIIGLAGLNFIFEFLFNLILAPALARVSAAVGRR